MLPLALMLCAAAPVKVAAPGFTIAGIEQALGDAYVDHFVSLLARDPSIAVTTQRDIAQVLGLERQKQLLGCTESSAACLAELAGALGSDAILSGSIAKAGSGFLVTLRLLAARNGSQLYTATERLGSEDALQDWLEAQAGQVVARLRDEFKLEAPPAGTSSGFVRFVPAMAGVVLIGSGAGLFAGSLRHADALSRAGMDATYFSSVPAIESSASNGRLLEGLGLALLVTGAVLALASLTWVLLR